MPARPASNLIVSVDDLDQAAAESTTSEDPRPHRALRPVSDGELADPSGNTVTFAQTLTEEGS